MNQNKIKIAWIMQCHKNSKQINRLLMLLSTDKDDVFIHCDKKHYDISNQLLKLPNVKILSYEESVPVYWGNFSQCQATLRLIENVIKSTTQYDYVFLISGQCYLIKSITELKNYLLSSHGQYIDLFTDNKIIQSFNKRMDIAYGNILNKNNLLSRMLRKIKVIVTGGPNYTFKIFKRSSPFNQFYYGSSWWGFSCECVKEIYTMVKQNPRYVEFYKQALCPDESFFQTLFMQTKYSTSKKENLWYIDWSGCKNNPRILGLSDYQKIKNSKKYIARKFDSNIDSDILYKLEKDNEKNTNICTDVRL